MAQLMAVMDDLLQNWRSDLSPAWSAALAGIEPNVAAIDPALMLNPGEVVFPARKGKPPAGARTDSHIFRALDSISPKDVRVVVMGQDPYTHVEQATGRSFEQGDLSDWLGKPKVTPSLRRILQSLAVHRSGNAAYAITGGWKLLVDDLRSGKLKIEPSRQLWDHWQTQGVIFINAILTFNRFEPAYQFRGHQPLWAPVIHGLLKHLVSRQTGELVCVGWGGKAQSVLQAAGVEAMAREAGTWESRVRIVAGPHPNAPPMDKPPFLLADRLAQVNQAVTAMGGEPIRW